MVNYIDQSDILSKFQDGQYYIQRLCLKEIEQWQKARFGLLSLSLLYGLSLVPHPFCTNTATEPYTHRLTVWIVT